MPEGHKTHFLAREHTEILAGQKLSVTSPQGRFAGDAKKVHRRTLVTVTAAGKHLFYQFESGRYLHVHLGRYGSFRQSPNPSPEPRGRVRARLVGDRFTVDLNGPTTCRVIGDALRREVQSKLGPDPLAGGKKRDVWPAIHASGKPIAALLLDQSIVAGIGNIFRAEILFETGIHPQTPGSELTKPQFDAIWKSTVRMMKKGLKYGRIISVTAREAGKPLAKLDNHERFRVYQKDDCGQCGRPIDTIPVASRKIYFCGHCQS